ncbi:hypothetical protein KCP70_09575 [Salmonella enterica subsp. enterica]|nr:hypothetical protein KCP70_09575 [Salmonella enterica subsp. enterica]
MAPFRRVAIILRFYPTSATKQHCFQLLEQIIVDFLAAEQTDKSGTEIFFGFSADCVSGGQETFFSQFSCSERRFHRRVFFRRRNNHHRLFPPAPER